MNRIEALADTRKRIRESQETARKSEQEIQTALEVIRDLQDRFSLLFADLETLARECTAVRREMAKFMRKHKCCGHVEGR